MTNHARVITDRLILKPVSVDDMDIYTALLTSPDTTRYLPGGKPFSEEYIASYLLQKIEHWKKGYGTFIVSLRSDPETKIGYAGIETTADTGFDDIRYALLARFQGKGYALEAAKAALEFTFANTDLSEIYGVAVTENLPSVRLLEKLGMTPSPANLYDSDELITMSVKKCLSGYRQINAQAIPMSLLLEADPSERCIQSYLSGSLCFGAFEQGELVGACVTNSKRAGISEIYNIAVVPEFQAQGIGSGLMRFALQQLAHRGFSKVVLGTGTFGYQLKFYQRLGFQVDGYIKDFFVDNYDEPVFERGRQHIDMVRLSVSL